MQTSKQRQTYFELELISTQPQPELNKSTWNIKSVLLQIGRYLLAASDTSKEPRISHTQDTDGTTWWNIYDPATGQSTKRESEQEVLIWLEERHRSYQRQTRSLTQFHATKPHGF